jgi:hypothetical protein
MLLELVAGLLAGLLVVAGIVVMIGPNANAILRRIRNVRTTRRSLSVFQPAQSREVAAPGLNPKTQRVLVGAARLANWLRAHGHDDLARELRHSAARMTGDEPAGLYAMQTVLRRLRTLSLEDRGAQERLRILSDEVRTAVQDRFEQLELLPFRRP